MRALMERMNDYRTLGRTGLRVSPLGLGVMTYGWGADKQAGRAMFDLYREARVRARGSGLTS
jgi:aryl-alcohol dehydrogenase-like predicted oxidoreductase